ncbi:MAG: M66 family metalloprotease [Myxococcota bacterium]
MTLFQTLGLPLLADGQARAPELPAVAGRPAVVRVVLADLDGWFEAAVTLQTELGEQVFTSRDSSGPELVVPLDATAVRPGAALAVAVRQPETGRVVARYPESGSVPLWVEETGGLKVHLVPFQVAGFVPDTSPDVIDGYRDALMAVYPVTDVQVTVGEVDDTFDAGPLDMGDLLVHLGVVQEQIDRAPQDVYYYGMVTGAPSREAFCASCPTGTSESGLGIRAAFAVGAAFGDARAEDTLIHEVGHMHGLLHAPCGGAGDVDVRFPDPAGGATEGWDLRTDTFVPATYHDLMGYCFPRWIHAYHYAQLIDWVQFAQGWSDTEP